MNQSKISVRYAKAFFYFALENKLIEQIRSDVLVLNEACKLKDFNEFLQSPVIPVSTKQSLFETIFRNTISKNSLDFLKLLTKNKREVYLKMITLDFLNFYRNFFHIKEVQLTTAVIIDENTKQQISNILLQALSSKIEISNIVDSEIIGGFKLRVDDKQIDVSIKNQLHQIKQELTKK